MMDVGGGRRYEGTEVGLEWTCHSHGKRNRRPHHGGGLSDLYHNGSRSPSFWVSEFSSGVVTEVEDWVPGTGQVEGLEVCSYKRGYVCTYE